MKTNLKKIRSGIKSAKSVMDRAALFPGDMVSGYVNHEASKLATTPVSALVGNFIPAPGASEALYRSPIGKFERRFYDHSGLSRKTKPFREGALRRVRSVMSKVGQGVNDFVGGVRSGSVLVPGVNI